MTRRTHRRAVVAGLLTLIVLVAAALALMIGAGR